MLWRKGLTAAAVAALAIGAAACGSGSEDNASDTGSASSTGAAADVTTAEAAPTATTPDIPGAAKFEDPVPGSGKGIKIGYISLGDQVPFVKLVSDDIKAQAKADGAKLVFCDSQLDAAKALDCAKNFKTQGVDAIINFQVDEKSAPRICAAGPDVPTIAVDINQKPCQVAFMGADNQRAGEIAGQAMGEYFKKNDNCEYDAVVSMQQPAAGVVNDQRSGGALKGFESVCGPIKNKKVVDGGGTIEGGREEVRRRAHLAARPAQDHRPVAERRHGVWARWPRPRRRDARRTCTSPDRVRIRLRTASWPPTTSGSRMRRTSPRSTATSPSRRRSAPPRARMSTRPSTCPTWSSTRTTSASTTTSRSADRGAPG